MRVVMLLSKSYREDARVQKEAQALRADGHDLTVIEWARHAPESAPEETVRGVRVVRFHGHAAIRALPGPTAQNPFWWRGAARIGLGLHHERPIDVVHAHDLDTLPAAVRIKRKTGARLVFDAHEIFSTMVRHDKGSIVAQAAERLERRLLPHVDRLITVNEALAEHYGERVRVPVDVVMNCAETPPQVPPLPQDPFTVVYVGLLSPGRFFPEAVDVLGQMEDVRFLVAGKREGNWAAVRDRAAHHGNVTFLGAIPSEEVLDTMAQGHAILCMLDPADPQYRVATATKVLDAMAVGRPSIATEGTYTGRLVASRGCGIAVPYSAQGLRDGVRALKDDRAYTRALGESGRRAAQAEFNWSHQADRLRAVYRQMGGRT